MPAVQIVMIWGALSGALFPVLVQAGEWEEFKALKEAMVRSTSKRDLPLPAWAAALDYPRPAHWQWVAPKKMKDSDVDSRPLPAPVSEP